MIVKEMTMMELEPDDREGDVPVKEMTMIELEPDDREGDVLIISQGRFGSAVAIRDGAIGSDVETVGPSSTSLHAIPNSTMLPLADLIFSNPFIPPEAPPAHVNPSIASSLCNGFSETPPAPSRCSTLRLLCRFR
ncbi:hypothetical protein KSP39_PZI015400 [Platanthera zijinensis]|uniref:Uncharacterized protein n=1 Tax=Platanthera zijinensis TaxID=2320716 RepID=A0AAP0G266_9ASPA